MRATFGSVSHVFRRSVTFCKGATYSICCWTANACALGSCIGRDQQGKQRTGIFLPTTDINVALCGRSVL
jgi:hypothetical protein